MIAMMSNSIPTIRLPLCSYFSPDAASLQNELRWCFSYFSHQEQTHYERQICGSLLPPRPQSSSNNRSSSRIPFLLLPHGAFCDSGPLVAEALIELDRETGFFRKRDCSDSSGDEGCDDENRRTIVLIGTEHASSAQNFISLAGFSHWRTPLGDMMVELDLFRQLSVILPVEFEPFVQEHSIENQLPFLQYLEREQGLQLSILPISVRGDVTPVDLQLLLQLNGHLLSELANVLREYSRMHNTRIAVFATTDYSHIGPAYGLVPPGWRPNAASPISIPEYIRQIDAPILEGIMTNDIDTVYNVSHNTSMCGLGAALMWLQLKKLLDQMDINNGQRRNPPRLLRHVVGSDIGPKHYDQTGFATFIML